MVIEWYLSYSLQQDVVTVNTSLQFTPVMCQTNLLNSVFFQRRRTVRTEVAIATVERSIEEDPNVSIRHRSQELYPYPSTLWKILRKDLGLRAYKIQLVQEIEVKDHQARRRFVEWAQNEIAVVPDYHKSEFCLAMRRTSG
ncbi:DUF4817 domain-containing protein [Trichonephila clavipes]|nr:DUF4817 domain-containing protein [Trichonephila clavipes]